MSLLTDLDRWIAPIGGALLHFLWQGVALALIAWALMTLVRSPRVRYVVGCAAMGLMLACPIATIAWIGPDAPRAIAPIAAPTIEPTTPLPHVDREPARAFVAPTPPPPVASPAPTLRERLAPHAPALVCAWLAGVAVVATFHLVGFVRIARLRRTCTPILDDVWRARVRTLSDRLGLRRAVALCATPRLDCPAVIGAVRPILLWPAAALTGLTPTQIDALIAHELAHVARHDYLVNLLQTLVETLLFYHPAVWWLSRRIRATREHCCDDLAANVIGDRLTYARALAAMERLRATPPLALSARGGSLLERVQRLLSAPTAVRRSPAIGRRALLTLLALTIALATWTARAGDDTKLDATSRPTTQARLIAPGDIVRLQIDGLPGRQRRVVYHYAVDANGDANFAQLGPTRLAGRTLDDIDAELSPTTSPGVRYDLTIVDAAAVAAWRAEHLRELARTDFTLAQALARRARLDTPLRPELQMPLGQQGTPAIEAVRLTLDAQINERAAAHDRGDFVARAGSVEEDAYLALQADRARLVRESAAADRLAKIDGLSEIYARGGGVVTIEGVPRIGNATNTTNRLITLRDICRYAFDASLNVPRLVEVTTESPALPKRSIRMRFDLRDVLAGRHDDFYLLGGEVVQVAPLPPDAPGIRRFVAGDVIAVSIGDVDAPPRADLQRRATIDADGSLDLASLGRFPAAGQTREQLEFTIVQRLYEGDPNARPRVTVQLAGTATVPAPATTQAAERLLTFGDRLQVRLTYAEESRVELFYPRIGMDGELVSLRGERAVLAGVTEQEAGKRLTAALRETAPKAPLATATVRVAPTNDRLITGYDALTVRISDFPPGGQARDESVKIMNGEWIELPGVTARVVGMTAAEAAEHVAELYAKNAAGWRARSDPRANSIPANPSVTIDFATRPMIVAATGDKVRVTQNDGRTQIEAKKITISPATASSDYLLAPGDLVRIAILQSPSKTDPITVLKRITAGGEVSLPYIEAVKIGGLSEIEAEQAIAKIYREKTPLEFAAVSVLAVQRADGVNVPGELFGAPPVRAEPTRVAEARPPSDKVAAGDLLRLRIYDLTGPGVPTAILKRVAADGTITLPNLKQGLPVAGQTTAEVERTISAAYQKAQVISNGVVEALVIQFADGRAAMPPELLGDAKPADDETTKAQQAKIDALTAEIAAMKRAVQSAARSAPTATAAPSDPAAPSEPAARRIAAGEIYTLFLGDARGGKDEMRQSVVAQNGFIQLDAHERSLFPTMRDVPAAGLTMSELASSIAQRMRDAVPDSRPIVRVHNNAAYSSPATARLDGPTTNAPAAPQPATQPAATTQPLSDRELAMRDPFFARLIETRDQIVLELTRLQQIHGRESSVVKKMQSNLDALNTRITQIGDAMRNELANPRKPAAGEVPLNERQLADRDPFFARLIATRDEIVLELNRLQQIHGRGSPAVVKKQSELEALNQRISQLGDAMQPRAEPTTAPASQPAATTQP